MRPDSDRTWIDSGRLSHALGLVADCPMHLDLWQLKIGYQILFSFWWHVIFENRQVMWQDEIGWLSIVTGKLHWHTVIETLVDEHRQLVDSMGSHTMLVFPYQMVLPGPLTGRPMQGGWKESDFQPVHYFISEIVQDSAIVTMEGE